MFKVYSKTLDILHAELLEFDILAFTETWLIPIQMICYFIHTPSAFSRRAVVSYWRKYVHEELVNRLGGLSLPRKSVVRLTDRPDMTLDVYRGRKTTIQQYNNFIHTTDLSVETELMISMVVLFYTLKKEYIISVVTT